MSKHNKQRNQQAANSQSAVQQQIQPTIKVIPEIETTEEGEKILKESLEKMDSYVTSKKSEADAYSEEQHKQADEYYAQKLADADKLREKAKDDNQREVDKAVDKAVKIKQKEMQDQVDAAKKEAGDIIKKAKKDADAERAKLTERAEQLDKSEEELTKKIADLELSKVNYKKEVLSQIQDQLKAISSEKEQLSKELDEVKTSLKKKESDIEALEEDKDYYEKELSTNEVKRCDILGYQTKISTLEGDLKTINEYYKDLQETNRKLKAQILLYGDDPSKAIKRNAELEKRVAELESLLSNCPSKEEIDKLRATSANYEKINNDLENLKKDKLKLEAENVDLKVDKDEIESYRKFIKILELQKGELQRELDRNIDLYNSTTEKVFASLSLIDDLECKDYPTMLRAGFNLETLCNRFRGYLANRPSNPLYYEEKTIRTFIAGFASSRLMILEGLSGTGKSSLPRAFADFMGSETIEVPVQSSWKDRNDLLGFYNDFKKQYKETEFLKALYRATHDPNNIYIIVLDEMNLSRIEYYFADLLSVLEKPNTEDWKIELISDFASINQNTKAWPKLIHEGKLQISDNTWFVGTANKDDSTFIITDKVYDRSVVLNFDKKGEYEKIEGSNPIQMNNTDFQALLHQASRFVDKASETRYREMIKFLDETVIELFQITFGNRIAIQLDKFVPAYIACGGTVDEAIDIMFSRKVLRKLEGLYDENTKENLDLFKEEIKNRKYNMPITIKAIERMVEKI